VKSHHTHVQPTHDDPQRARRPLPPPLPLRRRRRRRRCRCLAPLCNPPGHLNGVAPLPTISARGLTWHNAQILRRVRSPEDDAVGAGIHCPWNVSPPFCMRRSNGG